MVPFGYLTGCGDDARADRVIEVLEGRLRDLLRPFLAEIAMDEAWYLTVNEDVSGAVQSGVFTSARDHYVTAGYFEDRLPRPVHVDEAWYRRIYPDVAEAIRAGKFTNAQQHFGVAGFKEGRKPSPDWSLLADKDSRLVRAAGLSLVSRKD
jgi:hypothetical protein